MSDFDEIFKSLVKFLCGLCEKLCGFCVKPGEIESLTTEDAEKAQRTRRFGGVRGVRCEGANCDLETWRLGEV